MARPDPLIMSADIARMASERPELDEDLIQALYQHLVLIEERQPTIDELRAYVDRVSSLDQGQLRQRLGLGPRRRRQRPARARPTRGRPKGTRSVTRDEIVEKFRSLRANYGRAPTQVELAANLKPRIETRTLQEHLSDYGLGWPIE